MRVMAAGEAATLVELAGADEVLALLSGIEASPSHLDGLLNLVPAARTLLVEFDRERLSHRDVEQLVRNVPRVAGAELEHDPVEIRAQYDGPDLAAVCRHLGMDRREFIAWHTSAPWRVVFTGFAPGFGYLTSPDHTVSIPRLASPRTTVPAGSIAMGGEFTGIYPRESPGGWQIIGATEQLLFDLDRDPPALLVPGRPVQFHEST